MRRRNRELLVLKPNRAYGGTGVVLGAAADAAEWERLLDEARRCTTIPSARRWCRRQRAFRCTNFPWSGPDGRVFGEPFYAVMGFAATENGLGTMCRVSQKQVVNVAQRGGLAAVLEANAPPELTIPKRSMNRTEGTEQALRAQIGELRHLDHTIALLGWDEETMLPASGARGTRRTIGESGRHPPRAPGFRSFGRFGGRGGRAIRWERALAARA